MTKNNLLSFLLAVSLLGHTVPAHSMQQLRNLCRPITAGLIASAALNYRTIEENKKSAQFFAEIKHIPGSYWVTFDQTHCDLRHHEKALQEQLQDLAHKYHNLGNVTFIPTEKGYKNKGKYAANTIAGIIFIPKQDYIDLLTQLSKDANQDVTTHPDNASMIATLHHECGHIKYKSTQTSEKIESFYPAIMGGLIELKLGKKSYKELLRPRSLLAVGACYMLSRGITLVLEQSFGKYDETRADDTIPNDPLLLRAAADHYSNVVPKEQSLMDSDFIETIIKIMKRGHTDDEWKEKEEKFLKEKGLTFSEYFHTLEKNMMVKTMVKLEQLFIHPHPSNEFRAERFKARLAALENAKKS